MATPRKKAGIEISSPSVCPAPTNVSEFGTIDVAGTITTHSEVWARIYRTGDELGTSPPGDATQGTINGGDFTVANVPRARASLPGNPLDNNNRLRVWGRLGDVWEPKDIDPFCGRLVSATVNVTVSSLHCIWFCWADLDYPPGPFQESGAAYHPQGLVVPSDATRVVVTANGAHTWTHDVDVAGRVSDADGLSRAVAPPCGLLRQEYKNTPQYHSANINPLTAPLNKLVGIWESNDSWPAAARNQIEMGLSYDSNNDGGFAAGQWTRLFLAMHDGQEWSDNQGTVAVTAVWS